MSYNPENSKLTGLIRQAEDRLQSVEERLVNLLIEATYGKVGLLHINLDGPQLLGRKCFDRIFYGRRLPSLRELTRLAERLNMELEVLVLCRRSQATVRSFKAVRGFSRAQLREFLQAVQASASPGQDTVISRRCRSMIDWLGLGRARIYWRNLAIIAALCGYAIDIKLVPKDRGNQALLQRLDYPL